MGTEEKNKELIILGMGNKFFGDDGVGIIIAEKLRQILKDQRTISVKDTNWGGFRIIDLLAGFENAIIIDALKTGTKPVGYIHQLDYKELVHSVRMVSFHDINFATAVEFAKKMDIPMPNKINVFAIEIETMDHFSEQLTSKIKDVVDVCIQMILDNITEKFQLKVNQYEEVF